MDRTELLQQVEQAAQAALEAQWAAELAYVARMSRGIDDQMAHQAAKAASAALTAALQTAMDSGTPILTVMQARGRGELEAATAGARRVAAEQAGRS